MRNSDRRPQFALLTLVLAWLLPARAGALEVSLEENRAERGNIGFVDLKTVFRAFPETLKAKQSYAEIVRQAEEKVNLKKAELMALRSELAALKTERKLTADSPVPPVPDAPAPPPPPVLTPAPTVQAPVPPPAPLGPEPAPDAVPAPEPGNGKPHDDLSGLPGMAPLAAKVSTEPVTVSTGPTIIDIPGLTEKPIVVDPGPGGPPPGEAAARTAESARARAAAERRSELVRLREEALRAHESKLAELDAKISSRTAELSGLENGFLEYQGTVEKNLIDIENKRSEMLLGKIYQAIRRVARDHGVSVVVDKSQILFGQASVDLTGKVIKELEGEPL